jgi:hypothetical protein
MNLTGTVQTVLKLWADLAYAQADALEALADRIEGDR